jgi:hypothetical protein
VLKCDGVPHCALDDTRLDANCVVFAINRAMLVADHFASLHGECQHVWDGVFMMVRAGMCGTVVAVAVLHTPSVSGTLSLTSM